MLTICQQNLIPLLLRPLRLVLPADQLRKIRIWLLKALHWPFVACIIGYENGRQYLSARKGAYLSHVASGSDRSHPPAILRRPLSIRGTKSPSQHPRPVDHSRQIPGAEAEASHGPSPDGTISTLEQLAADIDRQAVLIKILIERERRKQDSAASA